MDALNKLRDADVAVSLLAREHRASDARVDAVVEITADGTPVRFAVEEKLRAPYPNELRNLDHHRRNLEPIGHPLLIVPYVSMPLGRALTEAGWSWADDRGNYDIRGPGIRLSQRRTNSPPKPIRRLLPAGSGSWAIIRSLVAFRGDEEETPNATALANQARVSQPRASQVLGALAQLDLVRRTHQGRWRPDRPALLDRFLNEYPGPGGTEHYLYSLDQPSAIAVGLAQRDAAFAISADVGPDLVAPWRRPSVVIIYAADDLPLDGLGLTNAQGIADANVIIRQPRDRSVYPTPLLVAEVGGVEVPLADPTQMIWDLEDLGGADRLEAAGEVRQWLLARH